MSGFSGAGGLSGFSGAGGLSGFSGAGGLSGFSRGGLLLISSCKKHFFSFFPTQTAGEPSMIVGMRALNRLYRLVPEDPPDTNVRYIVTKRIVSNAIKIKV